MSTIDKTKTCERCPDRVVEPNCHMTCEGYLARVEKSKQVKELVENSVRGKREAYQERTDAIVRMYRRRRR